MANVHPLIAQISGQTEGTGVTALLDLIYLFKGKLRAAATRENFHDSVDLRWLEGHNLVRLRQNSHAFDLYYVGLALKHYPELHHCFTRIGINVQAARARVASQDLNDIPRPATGDVQQGLLAPPST